MDFAAFIDGSDTAAPPPVQPAEAPPPAPEQAPEPDPAPAPETPPEPAPPPSLPDPERTAPLTALLDERDKRKAAERERDELRAAQQRQPAADVPDPYDDPDGYRRHVDRQIADQTLGLKFELSESMARDKHGDETVEKAMEWGAQRAQANPGFRDEFLASKNPIDWVVRQQKQDLDLSDYSKDPVAFARRILEANGQALAPDAGASVVEVPEQQQAPRPPSPPRSIASQPSSGGSIRDVAIGLDAGLSKVFGP